MTDVNISSIFQNTIGALIDALAEKSDAFVSTGYTFLSLAIILTALSSIYVWWVSGSFQDFLENAIRSVILLAPLIMILNNWTGYMANFSDFFTSYLPSQIGVSSGDKYEVVGKSISRLLGAVDALNPMQREDNTPAPGVDAGAVVWVGYGFAKIWDVLSSTGSAIADGVLMKWFYFLVMWLLVAALTVMLVASMIFSVFMPVAGLAIGSIFGPLIISWLPWKPLSSMTERWTSFMISNGITFVVALTVVNALGDAIAKVVNFVLELAKSASTEGALAAYGSGVIAIAAVYLFAINLLTSANNIANGMTGGTALGEGMFGKIASLAAGAGVVKSGKSVIGGAAGAAKGGAKSFAGGAGWVAGVAGNGINTAAGGSGKIASIAQGINSAKAGASAAASAVNNSLVGKAVSKGSTAIANSSLVKDTKAGITNPWKQGLFSKDFGGKGGEKS